MTVKHIRTAGAHEMTSRLARIACKLSSYSFTTIHRPGEKHGNADGLSRLGDMLENSEPVDDPQSPRSAESPNPASCEAELVALLLGPVSWGPGNGGAG